MTPNFALEKAFVALITPVVGIVPVYPGLSNADKAGPCVICAAQGESSEEPLHSGNYWVTMDIGVKMSAADNTAEDLEALASLVESTVHVDNLDAQLNVQGQDLTVFPFAFEFQSTQLAFNGDEGFWIGNIPVRVYCCSAVLTP